MTTPYLVEKIHWKTLVLPRPARQTLISQYACLLGRDQLISHATPANLTCEERHNEVKQKEIRNEHPKHNIHPGLPRDLHTQRWQNFAGRRNAQPAANARKKHRRKRQHRELK